MNKLRRFSSELKPYDRPTRAHMLFDKYKEILTGSVLDVGADAMYMQKLILSQDAEYVGIGYGENIDFEVNLEDLPLNFESNSFETVLCFDVLEHLENLHQMFDELCRISDKYVIISLPNPWKDFFSVLLKGDYSIDESMKFYGLPVQIPKDRHRWFFSESDAIRLISELAKKNNYTVIQQDSDGDSLPLGGRGPYGMVARLILRLLFRKDINACALSHGTSYYVLQQNETLI